MSASILGPSGMPMVELGGERAWLVRVKGDIVCSFQWLDRPAISKEGPHPCMALYPAVPRMEAGAYVVPYRNIWAYANEDGSPSEHLLNAAFQATIDMGFFPDQCTVHRVVDIIVDGLEDLKKMPSEQPAHLNTRKAEHFGIEASAKINGRTIHQEVL